MTFIIFPFLQFEIFFLIENLHKSDIAYTDAQRIQKYPKVMDSLFGKRVKYQSGKVKGNIWKELMNGLGPPNAEAITEVKREWA